MLIDNTSVEWHYTVMSDDSLPLTQPLSDLIRKRVKLTKAGREWKGLCPFHEETSPSFYVNDEKGFYHCFSCSAHGDAAKWAEEMNRSLTSNTDSSDRIASSTSRRGGGKLNRSETVTVRLDPKLNYLCELASRAQRRTKSSFIEWAVAEALGQVFPSDVADNGYGGEITLKHLAASLWHVDEADRVVALAIIAPSLLTHDEQVVWRLVRENGYLWRGRYNQQRTWVWDLQEKYLIRDRLREHWENFKAVAAGELSEAILPSWLKQNNDAAGEFDDEIPF